MLPLQLVMQSNSYVKLSTVRPRREKNPTRCHWMVYCTYNMLKCFGHFYAHHQELETICVLLSTLVFSACLLVVGSQVQSSRLCVPQEGCCTLCNIPLPGCTVCCPAS